MERYVITLGTAGLDDPTSLGPFRTRTEVARALKTLKPTRTVELWGVSVWTITDDNPGGKLTPISDFIRYV